LIGYGNGWTREGETEKGKCADYVIIEEVEGPGA
jgi:hypothetical protein